MKNSLFARGVGIKNFTRLLILLCSLSEGLFAETVAAFDPFVSAISGQTVVRPSNQTNVDAIVHNGKHLVDPNTLIDNTAIGEVSGREYKTGDAERQANVGKGAAIAAGTALTATAVPMLASPIAAVRAAGAALMVKAGLEFAQAAADSQVARKNGDQKNTLLSDDGQSGSGASSQASVRDQIRNPQLEKLLQEKGVSPDSFMDRLASGGIGDTQEMLKALGETDSVSAEDLAQAESQANNQFGSVLSDVYARPEFKSLQGSLRVGFDDKADVNPNLGSSGGNSGSGGIRTSSGSRDVHGEGAASPSASTDSVVIWDKDSGEVNQKSSDSLAASREFEGDPSSFIRSYFGIGANGAQTGKEAWQNTGISRERLAAIGISKQSVWQSIFQIGHRNYRGYRKWRGGLKSKTTIKSSRNLASVEKSLDSRQGN